ncbi:ribose-5-phosphate isomerase RpiA [Alkalibacillus almallahensis]|uniref:ribose-5-phosphate isomerase RpiA n=1 Tax=Alkalibacillus almallahensis TaxID=1379154 RepID=UPI00141EAA23|nr:ribose-5-phosphate isomerase RpiA [Alkalibacillus almallahensis]NIK11773.1 ribose 5-phosphate isomerase A [Alkalibacillus almallahensis]
MNPKTQAALKAVEYIEDGMVLGLGTGSTMNVVLEALGERVRDGLDIKGVPTSVKTEKLAREYGVELTDFSEVSNLDLAIDGADEVDPNFQLLKGGGGSLLREKIVDVAADRFIVVADESKQVEQLGAFPLPVEVVPFGWEQTQGKIEAFGCEAVLRETGGEPFVTDNGLYILDCHFERIEDSEWLHNQLKSLVGVVETGLFLNMTDLVIVGREDRADVLD